MQYCENIAKILLLVFPQTISCQNFLTVSFLHLGKSEENLSTVSASASLTKECKSSLLSGLQCNALPSA